MRQILARIRPAKVRSPARLALPAITSPCSHPSSHAPPLRPRRPPRSLNPPHPAPRPTPPRLTPPPWSLLPRRDGGVTDKARAERRPPFSPLRPSRRPPPLLAPLLPYPQGRCSRGASTSRFDGRAPIVGGPHRMLLAALGGWFEAPQTIHVRLLLSRGASTSLSTSPTLSGTDPPADPPPPLFSHPSTLILAPSFHPHPPPPPSPSSPLPL
jgi:hypothetical protein